MLSKFAHLISENLNWKFAISLVFVYIVCSQMFDQRRERLNELAGKKVATFDSEFHYSATDMPARLKDFGAQGRKLYAISEFTLDLLFPFVYSFLLAFVIAAFWGELYLRYTVIQIFSLLPFLAAGFDILENISLGIILLQNPAEANLLMKLASWFTTAKSSFLLLSVGVLVVGLMVSLFQLMRSFFHGINQ